MAPPLVKELHPASNPFICSSDAVVGLQIDFLIFQAPPQALHKNIVHPAPFAIHTDAGLVLLQNIGKAVTGKLTTLIAVEYFGLAMQ